ncbi:MAG: CRISPR-associated endonuclease Cas2 [Verrucomicrobia bacterium RIFCSPLOWO2_12_FULL_64_8]|nr:MAG: CRISPR-associated endonuclease Cas2 [Verrucomicrobia bacterium RIFCSPLOWO2_12_FULL_64_8]
MPAPPPPAPASYWDEALPFIPSASELTGHRCGDHQMLTLIAYDITNPKRLHKVAKVCEDWGVRVQYSVFECRLEADAFDRFWSDLKDQIDEADDRLVAYKICLNCARDIRCAGTMVTSEKVVAYVC